MTTKDLRADWALGPADGQYLGILTSQPHKDRFEGGQKFAWSCPHVHLRKREAEACAQAELDMRAASRQILAEALAPERRYASITLGEPRMGYPGDTALCFEDLNGNGTNIVNLRPGDLPELRAAVIPEDPDFRVLQEQAIDALGPGARKWVQQAHAHGYRVGVTDMEHIHTTMTEAERVDDWLDGFFASAVGGDEQAAILLVRDMIGRRLTEQKEARRG